MAAFEACSPSAPAARTGRTAAPSRPRRSAAAGPLSGAARAAGSSGPAPRPRRSAARSAAWERRRARAARHPLRRTSARACGAETKAPFGLGGRQVWHARIDRVARLRVHPGGLLGRDRAVGLEARLLLVVAARVTRLDALDVRGQVLGRAST